MRVAALFTVALAGFAAAAPAPIETDVKKGDIQVLGKGICYVEQALGITSLLDFLDTALGGAITTIDDTVGVTDVENALGLLDCEPKPEFFTKEGDKYVKKENLTKAQELSLIQEVGKGVCLIEKALGVTALTEFVDSLLGGAVSTIEETLGVTYAESQLGLLSC